VSLWADFLNHDGRSIHKWKHYFPAYERHFARYVNRPVTFVEIGCGLGGSLQMWKRYLGPHAQIVGIDNRPECAAYEEDQIAVRIGDQADSLMLGRVLAEFGTPDVVLDDGSHMMTDVMASFAFLYPRTAADGVYMVEDLHTAYWEDFGGGLGRSGTFVELCKTLLDEINAESSRGAVPPTDFSRTTQSMHFYDSIAVFERGRTLARTDPKIPPPPPEPLPEPLPEPMANETKTRLWDRLSRFWRPS